MEVYSVSLFRITVLAFAVMLNDLQGHRCEGTFGEVSLFVVLLVFGSPICSSDKLSPDTSLSKVSSSKFSTLALRLSSMGESSSESPLSSSPRESPCGEMTAECSFSDVESDFDDVMSNNSNTINDTLKDIK